MAERELSRHRGLDGSNIVVTSVHGVVSLAGHVSHELQKDMAVTLVRNIDGVRGVTDNLQR
jgi:osmotically-inducible protein OsmY